MCAWAHFRENTAGASQAQCDFMLGRDVNCHITSERSDGHAKQLKPSQLQYYLIKILNFVHIISK